MKEQILNKILLTIQVIIAIFLRVVVVLQLLLNI